MNTFSFPALGTKWSLLVDHDIFPEEHRQAILKEVQTFENRFSRFLPESEVNQFRSVSAGTYEISEIFARILTRADFLRRLTGGVYDPAVGGLLERAGYGLSKELVGETDAFTLPRWSFEDKTLTLDGPVVFDLGGIGKGYCIDLVASVLERQGYQYYVVEGGGDMYGTTKRDGSPYRVALEWPGKPDTAFGVVVLNHQGVAVSDSYKRRWPASGKAGRDEKNWHHIVDPETKKSIEAVVGAAALARSAFAADSMTSALFLSSQDRYSGLVEELEAEYVVFRADGMVGISPAWPGELF